MSEPLGRLLNKLDPTFAVWETAQRLQIIANNDWLLKLMESAENREQKKRILSQMNMQEAGEQVQGLILELERDELGEEHPHFSVLTQKQQFTLLCEFLKVAIDREESEKIEDLVQKAIQLANGEGEKLRDLILPYLEKTEDFTVLVTVKKLLTEADYQKYLLKSINTPNPPQELLQEIEANFSSYIKNTEFVDAILANIKTPEFYARLLSLDSWEGLYPFYKKCEKYLEGQDRVKATLVKRFMQTAETFPAACDILRTLPREKKLLTECLTKGREFEEDEEVIAAVESQSIPVDQKLLPTLRSFASPRIKKMALECAVNDAQLTASLRLEIALSENTVDALERAYGDYVKSDAKEPLINGCYLFSALLPAKCSFCKCPTDKSMQTCKTCLYQTKSSKNRFSPRLSEVPKE